MTFPSNPPGQTTTQTFSGTGPHEVTVLTGLTVGNTLMLVVVVDGSSTIDIDTGADMDGSLANIDQGDVSMRLGFRKITGSDPNITVSHTGGSEVMCAIQFEVQDTLDPTVTPPVQFAATGSSNTPDPPDHTTGGGGDDHFFVAICGVDRRTVVSFPGNMTVGSVEVSVGNGGANDCAAGLDTHQLNDDGTFDPGTFGIGVTADGWCAATLRFDPAPSGVTVAVPLDTISAAGQLPAVGTGTLVDAPLNALNVIGQVPVVSRSALVEVPADPINETSLVPALVATGASVAVPLDPINETALVPALVATGASVGVPVKALIINEPLPGIGTGAVLVAPVDGVSLTDLVPLIRTGSSVNVPLSVLTIGDQVPAVAAGALVIVPTDAVIVGDQVPVLSTGVAILIPLDTLTLTDLIPVIEAVGMLFPAPDQRTMTVPSPSRSFKVLTRT